MKKIKFSILVFLLISILFLINGSCVLAKYILADSEFLIIEANLDRTSPNLEVIYSNNITNKDITVTIRSNEKIRELEGWNISEDGLTLSKIYSNNNTEDLQIFDLAGNTTNVNINVNNIDKVLPIVECINITNSNTNYPEYANSQKEINLKIKVSDNVEIKDIDFTKIKFQVDSTIIQPSTIWKQESNNTNEKIYNLQLTNIQGNGILTVIFEDEFVIDTADNKSNEKTINTNIIIDNINPSVSYSQESINEGKINAILTTNEAVQKLNGWDISSNGTTLSKKFISNVSYEITVIDYAGNSSIAKVNVTGATYISIIYASHNSNVRLVLWLWKS